MGWAINPIFKIYFSPFHACMVSKAQVVSLHGETTKAQALVAFCVSLFVVVHILLSPFNT